MKTHWASIAITFALANSSMAANLSNSGTQGATDATAVPEPSVVSLLAGAAVISAAFFLRRRRR